MSDVRLPYRCPALDGQYGPCEGLWPHDCQKLVDIHVSVDDLEPDRLDVTHMTMVLLLLSMEAAKRRDWPEILAVATGYPLSFVLDQVHRMKSLDIFPDGRMPAVFAQEDEKAACAALVLYALAVNGFVQMIRFPDGEDGFQAAEKGARARAEWRWDPSPRRCQDATRMGRQCTRTLWFGCFCREHGKAVLAFQPAENPMEDDAPPTVPTSDESSTLPPTGRGTICF